MTAGYARSGPLTPRQRDALAAAARGASAAETARELHVSVSTVKKLRAGACERLGVPNITAAAYLYGRQEL